MTRNPLKFDDATKSKITNKFRSAKYMLGFLEGNRVEGEIDDALVVGGHSSGTREVEMKIKKEITEEQDFFSGGAKGKVLGLGA